MEKPSYAEESRKGKNSMLQRTSKETKLDQRLGDQRDGASRPSTSLGYFVSAASPFELAALPAPEWSMHIVITASFLGG